ncbi:MAG: hypothetical protein Q7R95_05685 [bacterium]|nr:hypothetical protein [bacterium]
MILAQKIDDIIGQISPPVQNSLTNGDPIAALGKIVSVGVSLFLTTAGLFLLIYLLWGGLDWIISGGEKEKITKAQNKIMNAVIGIVLVFVILTVFGIVSGDILGIVENTKDGWRFKINTFK